MLSRREFLRNSAAGLVSIAASRCAFGGNTVPDFPLGAQLYTVRKEAEADLPAVLRQIHTIGYQEIETYWNVYSHPASELRQMISDAGLKVPSGHFDYVGLSEKFDYARELGVQYMVCPMLPEKMWNSLDDYKRAADQFNKWGERAQSMGMRFAFHNHNYEFRRFGQTTGFQALVDRTDPKLVFFEMDCYWITQAGEDPIAMMRLLGNRIRMLHLKDRKPGVPPSQQKDKAAEHFTEVGNGSIDWKRIFAAARADRVEHMFIEQDECERPPMDSLGISYRNAEGLHKAESH
jgi:sugar phosphate isomerase/epimerase